MRETAVGGVPGPARGSTAVAAPESWLPLLGIKLAPPRVPAHAVARPRISERLDGPWRLAVVTGAPGTGKTVAVSQWFETLGRRAWVSLDAGDDRPAQFWLTVAAALDRAAPGALPETVALASGGRIDGDQLLVRLATEVAVLDPPVALVLDDLHMVRDRAVLDGLAFLVDHLSDGSRIVITSRTDPRLPIGRWRTRPWFVEIRQGELNFTPDEAETLFAAMGEQRLDAVDIEQLAKHTEGWAAALQLAALSMRGHDDPSAVARRLTGRHYMIADLLLSEVVERQPDDVREFMLQASIADHFDAELCNAITGRTDSAHVLRSLEAEMLFLLSVDDEHSTYRFHHLLVELLRGELARQDRPRVNQLHLDAADVFEGRGEVVAAIHHLLAAGQSDRAFTLAFGSAFERWDRGDISAAATWLDLFPPEYIEEAVPRMLVFALALGLCNRLDDATAWLERAAHRIRSTPPSEQDEALLDALRLLLRSCEDLVEDDGVPGQRAVEAVDNGFDLGTVGARARPNLARAYLLEDECDQAERVLASGSMGDELASILLAPAVAARIAWRRGHLNQAVEAATRALHGATALGAEQHFGTMDAYIASAGTHTDRNELAAAAGVLDHVAELAAHYAAQVYLVLVRLDRVRVLTAHGDLDGARVVIDEMRALSDARAHARLQRIVDATEIRWLIEVGEAGRAAEVLTRLPPSAAATALVEARWQLAVGRPELATVALDRSFGNLRDRLAAELLRARSAQQRDDAELLDHVEQVVALASGEGHVRTILEEGRALSRLVRAAAESSGTGDGRRLAVALGAAPPARRLASPKVLLTDRELAVLRYLPSRLTNQEIAVELFMSVNTVKTHLKSVYAKIGASSRSDAVRKARALDLLPV